MRLTMRRTFILLGATSVLLLASLTWTTVRAVRGTNHLAAATAAQSPPAIAEARERALRSARHANVVARLTWIAAILFAGAAFVLLRRSLSWQLAVQPDGSIRNERGDERNTMSLTDDLTGLNNRRGFLMLAQQQIKLARRNKREIVLLLVDVDDFKEINERFGRLQGDLALRRTTQVLRATFRDSDIIARLGPDEFVVLAADTGSSASIVERLRRELMQRNERDGYPYTLSLSVGAARFDPDDPPTIEELLQTADSLLYEQKRQRRHTRALAD